MSKHAELYVAQVISIDVECGIALQNWSLWKDRPDRERYVYLEDAAGEDGWSRSAIGGSSFLSKASTWVRCRVDAA